MENNNSNLINGPVRKNILSIALPTMFGYMFQAFYDIVDMIWIGFISPKAIAAMTIFSTFMWIIELFNEVVGSSSVALLSQYHGSGDKKMTQLSAEQTLIFKFLLACGGALVMVLTLKPVFNFFSTDVEVVKYGCEYGIIRAIFVPIFFSSFSVNTIFRCSGNAQTPMRLLIISAVTNIVLDPILMFDTIPLIGLRGFGLGMKGAAIATVSSISFSFVVGFILLVRGESTIKIEIKNLFKLDRKIDYKLMTIGLPNGINLALRNIFSVILMKVVSIYGTEAVAIVGISGRLINFGVMPLVGMETGGGILIGHALGANNEKRALEVSNKCTFMCFLITCIFAIPLMIFPKFMGSIFLGGVLPSNSDALLIALGGVQLILLSLGVGYSSSFSGSGMQKPILYSSFIAQYAFQLPYIGLCLLLKVPVSVLWFVYVIGGITEVGSRYLFWRKKKWLKYRVQ